MAVDTRAKRLSILNFGDGTGIHLLPDPNVSGIDQGERQTLLDCYSGILFAEPSVGFTDAQKGSGYMAMAYHGLVSPPSGW